MQSGAIHWLMECTADTQIADRNHEGDVQKGFLEAGPCLQGAEGTLIRDLKGYLRAMWGYFGIKVCIYIYVYIQYRDYIGQEE